MDGWRAVGGSLVAVNGNDGGAAPSITSDACGQGQWRWASVMAGFDGELRGEHRLWVGYRVVVELLLSFPPLRMDWSVSY
jgi:hypothetical protein